MSKNIFILGLGGSGSRIVDLFAQSSNNDNNRIISLAMDTSIEDLSSISNNVHKIALTNVEQISSVIDRIGVDEVSAWFPINENVSNLKFINAINMHRGTNLWRLQGVLSFVDYILDETRKGYLLNCIDKVMENDGEPSFYIVSSLCGGTGSALFIIVSYFISNYVKEIYNREIKFDLLLTCPDIYSEVVESKFRTKCFANSYAALQELNSIILVANGYNEKAIKECKSLIDYKLYLGSKVIFDSLDKKYHTTDMLPINQAYLFDNLPTVSNVNEYESIINTIAHLIVFGNDNSNATNSNIYSSIFATKVRYPYQANIDYIVERKTLEDITEQWEIILNYISDVDKMDKLEKENNIKVLDSNFDLAENYLKILDKIENIDNIDESILKRTCDIENIYISIQYYLENEIELNDVFYKKITEDIFKKQEVIDSILIENIITKKININNINIFNSKKEKAKRKKIVVDKTIELNKQLIKYYVLKLKEFYDYKLDFINQELMPEIRNYLSDSEGKQVHPITAFLRLLRLYKDLITYLPSAPIISEKEMNTKGFRFVIPDALYEITQLNKNSTKYLESGKNRFLKVVNGDVDILNKLNEDYTSIQEDALIIIKNIKRHICSYYLHTTCDILSKLIFNYTQVFKKLKSVLPYYEEELQMKRFRGINSSILCMNFGVSTTEKENLYKEFAKTENYYEYDDSLAGEVVFKCVLDATLDEKISIERKTAHQIYDSLYKFNEGYIESNPVIQRIKNANLFDVLQNETIFENIPNLLKIKNKLSRIMGGTISPLVLRDNVDNDTVQPNITGNIVFSNKLFNYVINNKTAYGITALNEKRVIDEFLYKLGNTKHAFKINDYLTDKEILITNEISHMPLSWFSKLDELSYDSKYYKNYIKAMYDINLNSSELWNPYIFNKKNNYSLLYFNPIKQSAYESDFVKALLWLLISKKIYLDVVDKNNRKSHLVYHLLFNGDNNPILLNNQPIYKDEIDKLLIYTKLNNSIVEEYSNDFNDYYNDLLMSIIIKSKSSKIFDVIENKIMKSLFVQVLINNYYDYVSIKETNETTNLLNILCKLDENNFNNKDTVIILKVIFDLIKQIINKYLSETEYDEKVIMNRIIKSIVISSESIIADLNKTSLEKILKKVSK